MPTSNGYLARIVKVQAGLNVARLMPSRIVLSNDVMYEIQNEAPTLFGMGLYSENFIRTGELRETLLGLPVTIDPRVGPNFLTVEIDA